MKHLWAPWRISYILGPKPDECVFCLPESREEDEERLVLHRGKRCFVIMNKYPYNNGHIMVCPYRHVMRLTNLSQDEAHEMMDYLHLSQDPEYREKHPSVREGVGLAAPQAGKNLRMLVISYFNPTEEEPERVTEYALVNPKIVVKAYNDLTGKEEHITARGYDAIVLQHEIDHLDGILFYDRIDKNDPFKIIEGAVRV